MLTGIKIHIDGIVREIEAPDNFNCGEFLAFILEGIRPGASPHDWSLVDEATGLVLRNAWTLEHNGVRSGRTLRLIPSPKQKAQDLQLEIVAPNGSMLRNAASSTANVGAFISELLTHFHLHPLTGAAAPQMWVLSDDEATGEFDPALSLAENGVATGDRLYLRLRASSVKKVEEVVPVEDIPAEDTVATTEREEAPADYVQTSRREEPAPGSAEWPSNEIWVQGLDAGVREEAANAEPPRITEFPPLVSCTQPPQYLLFAKSVEFLPGIATK